MKKYIFLLIFLVTPVLFLMVYNVLAAGYIKTTEFFVMAPLGPFTSATSSQFTLYIGDNLAGVPSPLKSMNFVASGVYSGNGTLELKIDNDAATAKTYTLANVASPTPFEILYRDDSNKINPASAGSYTYTFYATPSGVDIYDFTVMAEETHQTATTTCADGVPANEKIKSTEFFVMAPPGQVTTATSSQFTLYIGDNLTGVTNPVKAAYFFISGVYTGSSGSLEFRIDNDTATAKTYTLPNVTSPTPFEIVYRDDTGKINPTSAGSYSYTLNVIPSNVTISGLSARGSESHRYKPASCGSSFAAAGNLTSMTFDTTAAPAGPAYNSIMWKGTLPAGTKVRLQLATSDCANGANNYPTCTTGGWNYIGVSGSGTTCLSGDYYEPAAGTPADIVCYGEHNNKRYFRYKITLCSSTNCTVSGTATPQVDEVVVNWSP